MHFVWTQLKCLLRFLVSLNHSQHDIVFTKAGDLPLPLLFPIPGTLIAFVITRSFLEVHQCEKFKLNQSTQCCTTSAVHCWEPSALLPH